MVKFSKELEAQLIPEWKDAFVNYWQLKKLVKRIKLSQTPNPPPPSPVAAFISSLAGKFRRLPSDHHLSQVKKKKKNDSFEDGDPNEHHETELSQFFSEEDEVKIFFETLNEELEKVNEFYGSRESEFMERGDSLREQLGILLEFKRILEDRRRKISPSASFSRSSSTFSPRHSSFSENTESNATSAEVSETDEAIAALEKHGVTFINAAVRGKTKKGNKPMMALRVHIPATTPSRTISAVMGMLWEDLINNPKKDVSGDSISRKKIQWAEKMIRGAFVELYKGLGLLKTFSWLNMKAFVKILKKFDKVANQKASASYLQGVKKSAFISSDKVVRLMDEVESIFTKHFANDDRKKAMKYLRPQQPKDSHMTTFFVGLFTGCFVSLFIVYATLAHLSGVFSGPNEVSYMDVVYPVFSMFALLSLHMFMYGCNLFTWKQARINYNFIFEFQSSTALKYRDAFLICTTTMTAVVGALVIHLILGLSGFSPVQVDYIPGLLLLIFVVLLICPFDMFYRPTRYYFLRVFRNTVFSPFYKVLLVDSFLADQLTSQITLLRLMESAICYFTAGSFGMRRGEICKSGTLYWELAYLSSFLPYYWRAMQCARRWFDDNDLDHLANLGKYASAMVAAGARLTYSRQDTHFWFIIVLVTSFVATIYQLYWDFAKDWGILNPKSRNPWLRDELILKSKGIYYLSIVLNVILRVAWVESVLQLHKLHIRNVESKMLDFLLASLEVIRRGHWNFYRLENEQLNNVGKYRAVKTVPLPFLDADSDG
ncbi:phosphate transporter PHO1-like isoform X1 [Cucurbita pepo subsp. pepo]|uniref:phosphate transporter PHO1-like isoform X1 n=1 Tax=Cucurbita pepo subsp. pepo TaxID=3664 RepID=UPI000C9DA5E6|nr:phosphate transporter PHO1-like isoform X1 [Cucurbita pepo subsp. pepo]